MIVDKSFSDTKTITLTLTQSCNLDCIYCYENHKSSKFMNFETAKKILTDELNACDGFNNVEIDLFGGEPFLKFDLIKQITEFILSFETPKKVHIFIVTNGTLVHGDIQEWLKQHIGYVTCGLSLDGTKEMTDINRSSCFDMIDLEFFRKTYSYQSVKMTVSPKTLSMLSDGVIYIHKLGLYPACNLAYNIDWSNIEHRALLERELNKLIDFYLSNPEIEPTTLLGTDISSVYTMKDIMIPYCGAGRTMKAYDIDGELYPCQFFMPLSVGKEKAKAAQKMTFYQDNVPEEVWDEKCIDCVLKSICPTCLGANYGATGNVFYHEDNYCLLTKIIMRARAVFAAKKLEKNLIRCSPEEKYALIKSILLILDKVDISSNK